MKLFLLLCFPFAFSAYAVEESHERACAADVKKFCSNVEKGEGRVLKCMKDHEAELSQECRDKGAAMKAKYKEVSAACKGDAEKFCKDTKLGGGRMLRCLKEKKAELSPDCAKEFEGKK